MNAYVFLNIYIYDHICVCGATCFRARQMVQMTKAMVFHCRWALPVFKAFCRIRETMKAME